MNGSSLRDTQPGSVSSSSSPLERRVKTVFYAPTRGRHYFTSKGAAFAEAGAMLARKYPTERAEYHDGRMTYSGFHYTTDERLVRVRERLARRILKATTASSVGMEPLQAAECTKENTKEMGHE